MVQFWPWPESESGDVVTLFVPFSGFVLQNGGGINQIYKFRLALVSEKRPQHATTGSGETTFNQLAERFVANLCQPDPGLSSLERAQKTRDVQDQMRSLNRNTP